MNYVLGKCLREYYTVPFAKDMIHCYGFLESNEMYKEDEEEAAI